MIDSFYDGWNDRFIHLSTNLHIFPSLSSTLLIHSNESKQWNSHDENYVFFNFIPCIKLKYEIFYRIYFSKKSIYIYLALPKEKSSKNIVPKPLENFSSPEWGDQIFFSKTRPSKTRILVKDSSPRRLILRPPLQKQPAIAPLVY